EPCLECEYPNCHSPQYFVRHEPESQRMRSHIRGTEFPHEERARPREVVLQNEPPRKAPDEPTIDQNANRESRNAKKYLSGKKAKRAMLESAQGRNCAKKDVPRHAEFLFARQRQTGEQAAQNQHARAIIENVANPTVYAAEAQERAQSRRVAIGKNVIEERRPESRDQEQK